MGWHRNDHVYASIFQVSRYFCIVYVFSELVFISNYITYKGFFPSVYHHSHIIYTNFLQCRVFLCFQMIFLPAYIEVSTYI